MTFSTKVYTTQTLLEFINSKAFKRLKNYPITKHRALSHINNPRANKDDKILYISYYNDTIVGYRLIMADQIIINGSEEKIGWYSCVWVNPSYRGKGIAKELVNISLKDWDNKIIFQGPVKASKNLYFSTGIFNLKTITGFRGYARFDSCTIITNKIPSLKKVSFLFKSLDWFLNLFGDIVLNTKLSKSKIDKSLIEEVKIIDNEINNFIISHQKNNLFKRNKNEYNWILKYPWVIEQSYVDEISKNYYFSSIAKRFKYVNVKFLNQNKEIEGFVIYQIRNQHLSIQYATFKDTQLLQIVDFTKELIKTNRINFFTTYNQKLIRFFSENSGPFLFKKTIHREFYYSKKFEHYFVKNPTLSFEAGDGDMIFT